MQQNVTRFVMLLCLAILVVLSPAQASAQDTGLRIVDDAGLFAPDALARAGRIARQIQQTDGREVYVHTFAGIPEAKQDALRLQGKEQFYENWLRELAEQAHVNGVCILIVKQPGRLQIGAGDKTRQKVFTAGDRDQARDLMLGHLREERYDQALVQGLQFIFQRMWENEHPQARQPIAAPAATQPASQPATQRAGDENGGKNVDGDFK